MRYVVSLISAVALVGCATPVVHSDAPMEHIDRDTEYAVFNRPDGFDLTVNYSRYQFVPESAVVAAACKAALTSTAWDLAKRHGKDIQPVNEQRIKISMGRNGFTGITSCSATVPVFWKQ